MRGFVFTHETALFVMYLLIGYDVLHKMKFRGVGISRCSFIFADLFSIVHKKERFPFMLGFQKLKELFTGINCSKGAFLCFSACLIRSL
ncbi:hypothetical protein [Bartonella jaculi]|uniref:hypothetical protein n=1 Tax=Bartonella jaculi TaxID=686226 RepID=UPI0031EAC8E9